MHAKKTEAVIAFRGDGAQAQRQLWFGERQGAIHVLNMEQVLRCVPRYEHLGTMFSADGTIAAELHHRLTKAIAAHHQVRRPILANKHHCPAAQDSNYLKDLSLRCFSTALEAGHC